jgi:hypothetical protein
MDPVRLGRAENRCAKEATGARREERGGEVGRAHFLEEFCAVEEGRDVWLVSCGSRLG